MEQTQPIPETEYSKETQRLLKGLKILEERLESNQNSVCENQEVQDAETC